MPSGNPNGAKALQLPMNLSLTILNNTFQLRENDGAYIADIKFKNRYIERFVPFYLEIITKILSFSVARPRPDTPQTLRPPRLALKSGCLSSTNASILRAG